MAYKNNKQNSKQNDKTGSKKWATFWVGAIIFVIIAAILAGVIGWRTTGFKDWTFGFGSPSISTPDNTDKTPDDGNTDKDPNGDNKDPDDGNKDPDDSNQDEITNGGMTISNVVSNGVKLSRARIAPADYADYGIDTQAESAYTLNATIKPALADDKRVEWTVSDRSGTLNAADYVTLNANGLSATVACKQAFDHQFTVTVKSLDNPAATATCTLDYVARVISVTVNMPKLTSNTAEVTYNYELSKYTIQSDIDVTLDGFEDNNVFFDDVQGYIEENYGGQFDYFTPIYDVVRYTNNGIEFIHPSAITSGLVNAQEYDVYLPGLAGSCFMLEPRNLADLGIDEGVVISVIRESCKDNNLGWIDITVSSSYNGNIYSSVSKTVEIWVDGDSLHIPVSSTSLDKDSIIF